MDNETGHPQNKETEKKKEKSNQKNNPHLIPQHEVVLADFLHSKPLLAQLVSH